MGEGEIERPYAHLQVTKKQAEVRVKALGGQVGKGKGSGRKSGTVERDLLVSLRGGHERIWFVLAGKCPVPACAMRAEHGE